ncbi:MULTISPECIES: hypothetical protein [Bacillus]|uniref:hypothetical protein n=1 Tax=Bacillus TaxID=1386 RepID=UPI0002FF0F3F|nr:MULTISPECIES: hypothetical protein [Bacillus]
MEKAEVVLDSIIEMVLFDDLSELILAASENELKAIETALDNGAELNGEDFIGATVLHWAI